MKPRAEALNSSSRRVELVRGHQTASVGTEQPARLLVPQARSAIRARALAKNYTSVSGEIVRALTPVDLEIDARSFTALVGRSGCGKSTLLRLLAGLEKPTTGSAFIGDEPVLRPLAKVRYVFQNYSESLFPWKTVGANVDFGLRHAYSSDDTSKSSRELVRHYLAEVGLHDVEERYPSELSGGMQQRVAIARALAARPEVLLLDEPFSAVDALSRAQLQDLILRLWQDHQLTILFVTHDIDEALYLADRVIVLKEKGGGIQSDIEVGFDRPRHQISTREHPSYLTDRRRLLNFVLGEASE